ncbi:MAG TPA: cache domain-containing protein [Thermoanaerobaculia bacterium]|nr:cache domain-containing protein [Thermoanaerobaculia bacterium]
MKRFFANRTFPLMTLVSLLALLVGYYLFYVRSREDYFAHRYVRLLTVESSQIQGQLSAYENVFDSYQNDVNLVKAGVLKSVPGLELQKSPPKGFKFTDGNITKEARLEGEHVWIYAGWKQGLATVVFRFEPFALIRSLPPDFETLFVARMDGTVLFQKNQNRNRELRIVNVKRFVGEDGKPLDLAAYSQSTSSLDVRLAGAPYKLFLRPCCRGIWEPGGKSPDWVVVGGAVPASTLSTQAWSISFTMGITLIALFVLALLCLPFLRLLAIGAKEKLRMADALWIGFTAILGIGLLTLLLLDFHAYRGLTAGIDKSLGELACEIKKNMSDELRAAWAQLDRLNKEAENGIGPGLASAETCDDLKRSAGIPPQRFERRPFLWQRQPPVADLYTDFERFTWTDLKGTQCFKWSLGEASDPLVRDVRQRRYFSEAMDTGAAVEPIVSWATGSPVVALSERIDSGKQPFVGVLGIEMSSLNAPVLPQGYGFAVIDEDGKVLFHSAPGRAGNEDFFAEVDNDRELRALVYARRGGGLSTNYTGRGHRLWVQPIDPPGPPDTTLKPLSWSLVVFSDRGEQRAFNVDVVTTAMLLLILHLLVYMVGCGSLRAVNGRYRAGWLWPERKGEEREKIHLRLTAFYLLGLIASVAAIRLLEGVDLLWFAFLFPWAVLLVSYRLCAGGITAKRKLLLGAGLAAALLLIYLTPWSGRLIAGGGLELRRGILLLAVLVGLLVFFLLPSKPSRFEASPPRWMYVAAASLLLALTAAMPAAAFFCVAHRAHLEAMIKRGQIELAQGRKERDERVRTSYAAFNRDGHPQNDPTVQKMIDNRLGQTWDRYSCFFFRTRFPPAPADCDYGLKRAARAILPPPGGAGPPKDPEEAWEPPMLPRVFEEILPLYNDDFVRIRRLTEDKSGDDTWKWTHPDAGHTKIELQPGSFWRRRSAVPPLGIVSTIPPVSMQGASVLWPVSLLLLGGALAGVAYFVAKQFFLFGLPTPEVVDPMSMASVSNQNFILVSPLIDELAQNLAKKGTVALIDLSTLDGREDLLDCLSRQDLASSTRICLHHFEHRLQDEEHNLLKLELMEELILGRDKPVIVLSHVVPAWYLLDRTPAPVAEDKALDPDKAAKRLEALQKERKEVQERWRGLLRRFVFWVCRNRAAGQLEINLLSIQDGSRSQGRLERLLAVAREESGDSEPLQKLAGELVREHLQDLSRDLFIDDLRERAEPYYRTLWAMCTEAEKVILVQLAEGALVNAKNAGALKMLMKRGLVKRDPSFQIMNESFRRFVARGMCQHEVRNLERKADVSAWGRIRAPFALVLLGVAAFIFITQRQAFDISIAFFTALATGLPVLFRVLGAVTPGQGKAAS